MAKVIITGYTIRLKKIRVKDYKKLRQFDGHNDLHNILYKFLNNKTGNSNMDEVGDQKTIFYDNLDTPKNPDCINFTAYIGSYGTAYQLLDHIMKSLKYTRDTDDTDAFPLQCTIHIPDINSNYPDIGFLISEKYKNRAAKGLFETHFKKYFSNSFPDYILEMEPIIPEEFFTFFKKGIISTTKIKSYSIPNNIEDSFSSGENTKSKASVELVIKNKDLKRNLKNAISNRLKNKKHINLSTLFTGYPITPEEITFTGTLNGKQTTVILKEEGETMVPGIDVTKQVIPSKKTGFPNEKSMRDVEIRYLNDLITKYK
jgi:hypothetical protein